MNTWMYLRKHGSQRRIYNFGRISLVPSAIKTNGRMIPYPFNEIFGVLHEHFGIIGIGTINRIGKPEILPHHNPVPVAGFEKLIIAGLPYPVTYHSEVHIGMICNGYIVLTSAVFQVRLRETPVSATADETSSVDIDIQNIIIFSKSHLPDTGLKRCFVRY